MNDDQTPSNDTLIFYLHAGKLVDMAAVSLLAALKHHKITQIHRGNKEINILCYETDLISVTFPESITDMLHVLSDRMDKPIAKWWKYHWERVFFRNMPSNDMIALFDQLVWLHDGSISFEQTARKLLDSDKLTNVQKFQIACTYCFIDDVNRLKQSLSPDEIHLATGSFCTDVDPFLVYWCCKIRHMTGNCYLTSTNINFFAELIKPICRKYYNHWPVLEYFWKQSVNEEEFVEKAERIINYVPDGPSVELIWHLLPKLTSSQLDSIIHKFGDTITLCFAKEPNYVEYTMLTWKRVVNLIDDHSLNRVLRSVTDMEADQDYVDSLLREMWLYMSEKQKKFIANQQDFDYVVQWIIDCESNSANYQLIFEIFLLWDSERRRQQWEANWTNLVIGQMEHKNKIEEIMKMIFDNNENIAAFKRTVMTDYNSIKTVCESLLSCGHVQEIQNYLNFCTEDLDVIRNLKKQIITSIPKNGMFYFLCDCCDNKDVHTKFEYFLRDIFAVDEIENFQKDVLMSSLEEMEEMLRSGCVYELIQCVEKYISNEEDLYTIKLHLIKYSRDHHIAINIKMADWVHFSSWCYEGNSSLTKRFKSSLQPTEAEVSVNVEMEQHSLYESFCSSFLSSE
ncbi:uncharacterized protein LOC135845410 isoform X2 [Planococcus citri]|uniref:uncharacterized protein LOC135845410 isoform X2 n=1 Tax=Planococcus citri TaxID=170843 RepID=UPI0031F82390